MRCRWRISATASWAGGASSEPGRSQEQPLSLEEREEVQTLLLARGYDIGKVDGVLGLKSRKAARGFQKETGLAAGRVHQQGPAGGVAAPQERLVLAPDHPYSCKPGTAATQARGALAFAFRVPICIVRRNFGTGSPAVRRTLPDQALRERVHVHF